MDNSIVEQINKSLDFEKLYKEIIKLNAIAWDGDLSITQIDSWLNNFTGEFLNDEQAERALAINLLLNFTYYTKDEVKHFCKVVFDMYIHAKMDEYNRNPKFKNYSDAQKEANIVKNTKFVSLGNPSESGSFILYWFRKVNDLPKSVFEVDDCIPESFDVLNEYYNSSNDKEEILVCFLGFEKDISNYVNHVANPSKTIAINGFPAYYPKMKDYSLLNNYELLSKIGKENVFYTTANNPFSAYNTLCEILEKFSNSILNICVLGNKPMALGACIFALNHPRHSKVSFPYPSRYKIDTSITSNNCWHYQIVFT